MALVDVSQRKIGALKSSAVITRYAGNPVLKAEDVPGEATLIFNAGVCKYQGKYVMAFRNDYASDYAANKQFDRFTIGVAFSDDGVHWEVRPKPCFEMRTEEIIYAYDPRLTVIDGRVVMCFAMTTYHGERGGVAVTEDFEKFEIMSLAVPDNRNIVLFPEKIGGKYARLERPFTVYSRGGKDRFDTWFSDSTDLRYWGNGQLVLAVEDVPFANDKVGPGAPPVRTEAGWLTIFHAVDRDNTRGKNGWEERWQKRYTAGIMLLDLENPAMVIGMSREPLLAPEAPYETSGGFRNNAVFPGGMVLEDSGEVKIYYGAADTVECLATADVADLVGLCEPVNLPEHRYC